MLCLGIETSCDDTGLGLVRDGVLVDSTLASQADIHAIFGGVVPELASREHYRFLGPMLDELLSRNHLAAREMDVVSVTRGPGLLGSLLVGVGFAKALALGTGATLVGVNHLYAHLLATGLNSTIQWPAMGLLVSGGHTHLYYMRSPEQLELLGRSLDDAAGEAFDKIGKLLGFAYPAGKAISDHARNGTADPALLPRALLESDSLDFSFSGLKAAAARVIGQRNLVDSASGNNQELCDFCASLNLAIADALTVKLERALAQRPDVKSVVLAGGVASNTLIRKFVAKTSDNHGLAFVAPPASLCVDNGAMVAYNGYLLAKAGLAHHMSFETIPRGRVVPDDFCFIWD